MPLKLVTGPANAAKAGEVLGGYRERLGEEPMLVVPAFGDVEHAQREMAQRGAVLGARVVRFAWLFEEIAARVGFAARVASELQREMLVEGAVLAADLRVLRESASRPGFVRAAAGFVRELTRSMVEPERFSGALAEWAGSGPRRRYADEVAAIYAGYRARLEEAGLVDPELFAWRSLDALRRSPAAWGGTPVFFYGFDDFTEVELDAIETLAGRAEARVVVSLPWEPGREAFKAIATVHARLAELADEQVQLEALDTHYDDRSRAALHHLERNLYEDGGARAEPGGAVRLLSAGGARAEVELVSVGILSELRGGTAAGDVAVVFRDPSPYGTLVEQVFGAYGIPFSLERSVAFEHTGLGRSFLALARCALFGGSADDMLTYVRAPGLLERHHAADALEAQVRGEGADSAARARELWEAREGRQPLSELDRLAELRDDAPGLIEELDYRLERLFTGPYRREARLLAGSELEDARAFREARAALRGMRSLAKSGGLNAKRIIDLLATLPVRVGEGPQPDRVLVAPPEAVRARRFTALFACGLQEGEFPRPGAPEPFLSDDDRRAIAAEGGLRLPAREDQLQRERYLFYVCASRAERLLVLSSRVSDEEGRPEPRSFFVEDVLDLFDDSLARDARTRPLSKVTWPPAEAPTRAEWERAAAVAGPRREPPRPERLTAAEVLQRLYEQKAFSAGALEAFAECPVKWLVDRQLRPYALEPDPDYLVRGSYAHAVLERTYRQLPARSGSRRVTRENLSEAESILLESIRDLQSEFPISPRKTRVRAAVRRLEFDLLRYLREEAESDSEFEPTELELEFGLGDGNGGLPALDLEMGVNLRGKIDRVDTWGEYALVRDYKSGSTVFPVAKWEPDHRLQVAVYMLAVEQLLGRKLAGGVYTPLAGRERRSRGMIAAALRDRLGSGFMDNDARDDGAFEAELAAARRTAIQLVERIRAGRVKPCPESCAWRGGCSYPSICREED